MKTFKELGLKPEILKALGDLKFETPTPIQSKTIPHLLQSKKDLVAIAQTGTGKTAAFSLPILQQIDVSNKDAQAIILCPTRELCIQIANDIKSYTTYLEKFSVVAVYGGESIGKQISALGKNPQIIVGTPGRTLDLIKRNKINEKSIKFFVMDEADEMLNMGFKDDLDAILENTPKKKQTLLFSATMHKSVENIAKKYMKGSERIESKRVDTGGNIDHQFYMVHAKDRYKALRRIADLNPGIYGIVFCRTKNETKEVADKLIQDHYSAEAIHGDLTQDQRSLIMGRFRNKKIHILVATDVAARGIDVDNLTHVINYNLPEQSETYVHRSGRTGRAGGKGISLVIINMREQYKIRQLERVVSKTFEQQQIPTGKEICEIQLIHMMEKISKTKVDNAQIEPYMDRVCEKLQDLNRDDLIKRLVMTEFARFLDMYEESVDLNIAAKMGGGGSEKGRGKRDKGGADVNFCRFRIEVGRTHGLDPRGLIKLVNRDPKLKSAEIGRIEIAKDYSYFEVEAAYEKTVMTLFKRISFNEHRLDVKQAETPKDRFERKTSFRDMKRGGNGKRGGKSTNDKRRRKK